MASLLTEPLFETSGRAPTANNFYNFIVTKSYVVWRWWKISPRAVDRYAKPGEVKESHQDFLANSWVQSEVSMVFGHRILQYTKALCQGHYDYLDHLPDALLLRIINCLELEDVGQLGRTSRRFKKLCGSEKFWEQAVQRRCNTVSAEMASLALDGGWRSIFFTSKLQLQKLIRRRRLKAKEHQEGPVSPDSKAEKSPDAIYRSDLDPDPKPKLEAGSDSCVRVPCQLCEDVKNSVLQTPVEQGTDRGETAVQTKTGQ
ncbi:F-box only protein 36b [Clinocottus analis]|uniref:F-box only protein 36b n=1 Tax=Clinocottus analis TaxID=304258 RepID=UPI0035C165AE